MPTSAPRTLADLLRSWSTEQLVRLLEARPDLGVPAPTDSAQLAARAATRTSVLRALDRLDALQLAVLEAIANSGETSAVHAADPAPATQVLQDRLLVWDDGSGLRPVNAVSEIFTLPPGPPSSAVPGLLAEVDDRARAILDHLEATGADGTVAEVPARLTVDSARTPTEQLLARRLLVPRDGRHVAVPWSVRLALRDGWSTREPLDAPPELALAPVDPESADHLGAGAAYELVHRTELLLDHWGMHPPAALRGGGLGVRDLKLTAASLHVETDEAALVIETASAAGLLALGSTDDLDAAWLPTEAYDVWLGAEPAARWQRLATAWLGNPRLTLLVGRRVGDKPVNALSDGIERGWLPDLRRAVLAQLDAVPHGQALAAGTGLPSLLDRMRWLRPRRPARQEEAIEAVLSEAAVLGFLGRGTLTGFARALLEDGDAAASLAVLLPEPVDHVLLQADLTAIAPGPLESELARRLGLLADVESRGGATVYRFAAPSVRRAFDAGWSAAETHAFLAEASRTPVPQALTYLVDDVARRFGVLRAGHASSFLRTDDETALAELLHHPQAGSLRLRRIAPTVAVSDVPLDTLLPRIRELGQAPVVEAPDGTLRVARPDVFRARSARRAAGRERARAVAHTAAVVAAIRSGDRAAATRPVRGPVSSPADVIALLRGAAEAGDAVAIGYVGNDGTVAQRVVTPHRVEGGRLTAYDERSDDVREFALHRITAAAPA